ncbi:MAG: GNAT family N-acetyltransferase [Actinoplanes sp.]
MPIAIRPLEKSDIDTVVEFSLRAWAPVFVSFEKVLGERIYRTIYPDWLTSQAEAVAKTCADHADTTWVAADDDGRPVGFATVIAHGREEAEIEMIAVDPNHQRRGIAAALLDFAVSWARFEGFDLLAIGTGGDPGHEPARIAYEKAGFTPMPQVRYYRALR